ncbi:MAG: hypothetical protein WD883_02805 [Candidatus Colwellbacteria bacterium]
MEEAIMTRTKAKRNLALSVCSFFGAHFVFFANDWYRALAWVDIPAHFLGGIMAAAVFYWFFYKNPNYFDTARSFWITLVMVCGWTALTGVMWEFTEFLYDLAIAHYSLGLKTLQFGLADTLGDLLADLTGGITLAIFVRLRYHR